LFLVRRLTRRRLPCALFVAILTAAASSVSATGSTIIDRNASAVTLKVNDSGMALVSYRAGGRPRRVVAWGAINDQVRFRLDYSGGRRSFGRPVWQTVTQCLPYDGPDVAWLVKACKAPDGSYWALQRWQRLLPSQGYRPFTKLQAATELHLSHWRGPLPQLDIFLDWVYRGRYHHLFGRYQYNGRGVHGHRTTSTGVPLDPYGRNIYLDSFGSAHGNRWARINAFIAHKPNGTFCYGFFPRRSSYDNSMRPAAHGSRYRATAIGPGVTPDAYWEHTGLGAFDAVHEADMNRLQDELMAGDRLCRQH
jgi:hypothetical protein